MTFRPLTALALMAVIATGCSETPTATETGSATETAAPRSKAVRFSECMRQNGVSAFPDPEPSGELTIDGVLNGSGLDSESAAWKQAISACKDLQPSGFTGRKATPKEQDQRLRVRPVHPRARRDRLPGPRALVIRSSTRTRSRPRTGRAAWRRSTPRCRRAGASRNPCWGSGEADAVGAGAGG